MSMKFWSVHSAARTELAATHTSSTKRSGDDVMDAIKFIFVPEF
jgi:hypothetical protein